MATIDGPISTHYINDVVVTVDVNLRRNSVFHLPRREGPQEWLEYAGSEVYRVNGDLRRNSMAERGWAVSGRSEKLVGTNPRTEKRRIDPSSESREVLDFVFDKVCPGSLK